MIKKDSVKRRLKRKREKGESFDDFSMERIGKKRKIDQETNEGREEEEVKEQRIDGSLHRNRRFNSQNDVHYVDDGGDEFTVEDNSNISNNKLGKSNRKKRKKKSKKGETLQNLDGTINRFYTSGLFEHKPETQLQLNPRQMEEFKYFSRQIQTSFKNTQENFLQIDDKEIYKDGLSKMKYNVHILTTYISSISSMRSIHDLIHFFKDEILGKVSDENLNLDNMNIDMRSIKKSFFEGLGITTITFRICRDCNHFHILPNEKVCHHCRRSLDNAYLVHYIPICTILYLMQKIDNMRQSKKLNFGEEFIKENFGVKEQRLYREGKRVFHTEKIFLLNCFTDAFTKNIKHKWCSLMRVLNFSHFKESIEFSKIFLNTLGPNFLKEDIRDLSGFITPMVYELLMACDPRNVFTCDGERFVYFLSTFTLDFEAKDKILNRAHNSECSFCRDRYRDRGKGRGREFSTHEREYRCSSEYQGNILHLLCYFNIMTDIVPCKLHLFDEGITKELLRIIRNNDTLTFLVRNLNDYKLFNTLKNIELDKFPYNGSGAGKKNDTFLTALPLLVTSWYNHHQESHENISKLIDLLMKSSSDPLDIKNTSERLLQNARHTFERVFPKLHFCLHFFVYYIYHGAAWLYHGYPGESVFSLAKVMSLATRRDVVETRDIFLLRTTTDIVIQYYEVKEKKERIKRRNEISTRIGDNKFTTLLQDNILQFERGEIVVFQHGIQVLHAKIQHFEEYYDPVLVCEVFTMSREVTTGGGVLAIIPRKYISRKFPLQGITLRKTVAVTDVTTGRIIVLK